MGIFDRIFGRKTEPADPEELRTHLFDAVASGDLQRAERLCRDHRDVVIAQFPAWQTVPAPLRSEPAALQRYGQGLIGVAQLFAERLGDTSLMERLIGPAEDNPLLRWEDQLGKADALIEQLEYQRAKSLLGDVLAEVRGLQGPGVDRLLPITLGRLAQCHFHLGEAEQSVPLFEQALARCEQAGDAEGIAAYLGSLYQAHRYLGRPEPAADAARRLAAVLEARGEHDEAARYRRQAELVAAGEPLNRVVAVVDGRPRELDELDRVEGRVVFIFERNRITLEPAREWTRRGEAHGSAGDHAEALAAFERAAAADPFDPHSRYQAAFTLLHLRRYSEAERLYAEVERLAPGWFHCRADRWLAGQLAAGAIDHAAFLALHTLQDGDLSPQEQLAFAEQAVRRFPRLPLLYLHLGRALAGAGRAPEAIAALRDGLALGPEPDARTRLLVELAAATPDPAERDSCLQEAESLAGNLISAATARALRREATRPRLA